MYDRLRDWVKQNIPGAVEVFLDVPHEELLRRDSKTKGVYATIDDPTKLYDKPKQPDVVVQNHGNITADAAAGAIREFLKSFEDGGRADYGRTGHWNSYYKTVSAAPIQPSSYAIDCTKEIEPGATVLDVGCGNGRDSAYFASIGLETIGIDASEQAVAICREAHVASNLRFKAGKLDKIGLQPASLDAIYCRFVLHAMTEQEEDIFIETSRSAS